VGPGPGLLAVDAHTKLIKTARAQGAALKRIMSRLKAKFPDCGDVLLAQSNILSLQRSTDQKRLALVNQVFQKAGLASVKLKHARSKISLDNLVGVPSKGGVPRQLIGHVTALSSKSSKATTSITALNQPKRLSKRSRQVVGSEVGAGAGAGIGAEVNAEAEAGEGARSSANIQAPAPLVSVIVPMYNAQDSIGTALQSLLEQTWRPLEIIVVDDASSDDSLVVVERMAEQCPDGVTLQLLRQQKNAGAYAARNQGLKVARGEFITTHDSDDWSHPEKIARQVEALLSDPYKVGCLSHWVRATTDLKFSHWFQESAGWTYRNMSSLMFKRQVFDTLGYWDEVKVNGDTEFHERVLAVFGAQSVADVLPGAPLAFGRSDERSLSQTSSTHLVTQFLGVRHDYMASARRWHQSAKQASDLRLEPASKIRPFPAPASICRPYARVWFYHPLDEIQASGLFDAGWYLRTNIDLQQHTIDALNHYWETGALEGRDPSPNFSSSGYLASYPDAVKSGLNPLFHYIRVGQHKGYNPLPVFKGKVRRKKNKPTVMLVGHAAGETLYGAERSLIDVAKAINHLGFNLVVVLPSAINQEYVQTLRSLSNAVAILPLGWWQTGRRSESSTIDHLKKLIEKFKVDLVHVNTLVLDEPLVAARQAGVPCLTHVRELPEHDVALCETLNAKADDIRTRVLELSDGLIANSQCVSDWLNPRQAERVTVIPNTIDMEPLLRLRARPVVRPRDASSTNLKSTPPGLVVGILSSNTPKKGLEDLQLVAQHLAELDPSIVLAVYGPRTAALEALLEQSLTHPAHPTHPTHPASGTAQVSAPSKVQPSTVSTISPISPTANIEYRGYADSPAQALKDVDVVVNLSQFQESFGRTVLEAMAAARPVVVYDWGALPELVDHGRTGFVVPFGDTWAVANCLMRLNQSPALRTSMGKAARQVAEEGFSSDGFIDRLFDAYAHHGLVAAG